MSLTLEIVLTINNNRGKGDLLVKQKRAVEIGLYDLAAEQRDLFEEVVGERLRLEAEGAIADALEAAGPTLRDAQERCDAWHRGQHDPAQGRLERPVEEELKKASRRSRTLPPREEKAA
jgi:hypothetical protein